MKKFDQLANKIYEILSVAELRMEETHAKNTLEWVFKLNPKPSESLKIAAISHDLERGFTPRVRSKEGEPYDHFKHRHSKRSAEKISMLMRQFEYDQPIINEVVDLVLKHEVGGNINADILMDADSISFFDDDNIDYFASRKNPEETRQQIEYKFNRCSKRAQRYIKEMPEYKKWSSIL